MTNTFDHAPNSARAIAATVLLLALLAAAGACSPGGDADPVPAEITRQGRQLIIPAGSPLRERLLVDSVRVERIERRIAVPATIEADPSHFARVLPPVAGRVLKLHVRFGDAVRAGQLLLTMSAPEFDAAQADYLRAASAFEQARRDRDRQADLHERGIAAAREVEQAALELQQATSERDRAAAHLRTLGVDPASSALGRPLQVRAPITGRVVELAVAEGEFRNDASAPLLAIADLSTVWLTAHVQEKDIRHVAVGQSVSASFAAYPDQPFQGAVLFVGDLLDPDTRTIRVRVAFPNTDARLKPGMFATATFVSAGAPAPVVPTTAVVQIRDTSYVFAEVAPWTFEPRAVTLGSRDDGRTVIYSGLVPGERIVVRDAVLLQ